MRTASGVKSVVARAQLIERFDYYCYRMRRAGKSSLSFADLQGAIVRDRRGLDYCISDDEFIRDFDYTKCSAYEHFGVPADAPREILIATIRNSVMPLINYACGLAHNASNVVALAALRKKGLDIAS